MLRDMINLGLRPFSLSVNEQHGLILKGTVDMVRAHRRLGELLRIEGLEILGGGKSVDTSCAFLSQMPRLRYIRLFAAQLTEMESIRSLRHLRRLAILRTRPNQSISINLGMLPKLEHAELDWFVGADSIFGATELRFLSLMNFPRLEAEAFSKLQQIEAVSLSTGNLANTRSLGQLRKIRWLKLADLEHLTDFSGVSDLSALRLLWIEKCRRLNSLAFLKDLKQLETIRIIDCGDIRHVEALRTCVNLRHVHIHGSTRIFSDKLGFFRNMPTIESVVIKGLPDREATYWAQHNKKYNLLRLELLDR